MSVSEAELEAMVHAALRSAFPHLPLGSIKHQSHFYLRLGHGAARIDSLSTNLAGRSDVLVTLDSVPLAVLELKRPGNAITDDDKRQGLSYARLTDPVAPLVIVSNGIETKIFVTYSGDQWLPIDSSSQALHDKIENVGRVAAADVQSAVNALMGTDSPVWASALQSTSTRLIEARTGSWRESTYPFIASFLIPRKATAHIIWAIEKGSKAIVLHGPPLAGKSNVLRELCERTLDSTGGAVLMLEASSDGVFSSLAHLLSRELSWNLAPEEAREWLRAISNFVGARLLIAIDGIDEAFPKLRNDIFEIVSGGFGPSLGIVVAVDDTVKQVITRSQNGREKNVLGRAAIEISVEPLDDEEFELALGVLAENKIQVTRGGESVQALREPWIIRALVPPQISDRPEDANWYVRIPPLLDVDSLGVAGSAIQNSSDTEAALRLTARAILEEYLGERKASAIIHGLSTFIVGKVTLENAVGQYSLEDLLQRGYLKAGLDQSGSPVWFIRVPALMANHVSFVIAEMICEWGEAKDVAKRLISLSTRLPFGDVVVAHALVECAKNGTTRNLYGVIAALLEDAPVTSSLAPGSKLLLKLNGTPLQVSVTSSGFVLPNGETIEVPSDELGKLTSFGGWLILSHLASVAIAVKQGSAAGVRMDPGLLEVVGASWSVLVRPDGGSLVREVAIHEIAGRGSAVCHLAGVVEPVTWAFVRLFSRIGDEELAEEFVQFAIEQNSMPLLLRISNALTETRQLAGNQGEWAKETLARRVLPLIRAFPGH